MNIGTICSRGSTHPSCTPNFTVDNILSARNMSESLPAHEVAQQFLIFIFLIGDKPMEVNKSLKCTLSADNPVL